MCSLLSTACLIIYTTCNSCKTTKKHKKSVSPPGQTIPYVILSPDAQNMTKERSSNTYLHLINLFYLLFTHINQQSRSDCKHLHLI